MSQTSERRVALVVVPRERASVAVDSLESIYENTPAPFDLIYIDCVLPRRIRGQVKQILAEHGHTYIRCDRMVYPNQARNMGISRTSADFWVFIDNDIFVEPDSLMQLVTCAEETGAGVVGPLYLEGDRNHRVVHCAGGEIEIVESFDGTKTIISRQDELGTQLSELPELEREKTGLIEFHCVLVTQPCLEAIGGQFDERLLTTREHVDLCLSAAEAGFDIYLEPKACVSYGKEEPLTISDLRYFMFRWSDDATQSTIGAFQDKWQVNLDQGRRDIIRRRRRRALDEVFRSYRLFFPVWASRFLLRRVGSWRRRRQQTASA